MTNSDTQEDYLGSLNNLEPLEDPTLVKAVVDCVRSADDNRLLVEAGYIYERKGYVCTDYLTSGKRNEVYGAPDDDVVLRLSVRLSQLDPQVASIVREAGALSEEKRQAKRAAIEEKIKMLNKELADFGE